MPFKIRPLFLGLTLAALACSASAGWAAPTVCTSPGSYDFKIAVASNFFDAAQNLVLDFTAPGAPGAGLTVNICQNATTELLGEITAGSSGYALFLAANAAAPDSLVHSIYVPHHAASKLYAYGVPVMFAPYNPPSGLQDVQTLIPGVASGVAATVDSVVTSTYALNPTTSATVAVADPTQAPYGQAAVSIILDMGLVSTWNPPTSPTWVAYPLYPNIDLTFQSVTTGSPPPNTTGFVSKGQICSGIGDNPLLYIYIEFTNSKYTLTQKGILVKAGNATQDGYGRSLFNFMLHNSDPSYWSNFLEENCYGQITGSRFFKHTGIFQHKKKPVRRKR